MGAWSRTGEIVPVADRKFICIDKSISRSPISLPLKVTALRDVVITLRVLLQHNFIPGVVSLAGVMQLHYAQEI